MAKEVFKASQRVSKGEQGARGGRVLLGNGANEFVSSRLGRQNPTYDIVSGVLHEGAVLKQIKKAGPIYDVLECGMIAHINVPWAAPSPEVLFVIITNTIPEIQTYEAQISSCIEIRTRVSDNTVDQAL